MPSTTKIERPVFRYKVPETARQFPTDPKSFAMRPITAAEERQANEAASSGSPLANELVRMSVCEVDGKPIDWGSDSADWLEKCSPKVRMLVFKAFSKVNQPADKDEADFLASEEVVAS